MKFGFIDFLDIVLIGGVVYYIYKLLKGTVAIPIFIGVLIVFFIHQITLFFEMKLLSNFFGFIVNSGTIALLVIFHPELRKFLLMIGSTRMRDYEYLFKKFKFLKQKSFIEPSNLKIITNICKKFSKEKIGALIIFERNNNLEYLKENGVCIEAKCSEAILESIFFKNSPLHDGAVIVKNNTIMAARVLLPVSEKKMPAHYGTRHRAAMGISERKDAVCLVISEETGIISIFKNEQIKTIPLQNIENEMIDIFEK